MGCDVVSPENPRGLRWEVAGEVNVQPLAMDSLLIVAFVDGSVKAFNKRDGALRWSRNLGVPVRARRMLRFEELVIVPARDLIALDASTGAERWRYQGADRLAGVLTPELSGDTLFAAGFTSGQAIALSARTGAEFWSAPLGNTIYSPTVTPALVVYPRRSLTFDSAARLFALDRATGQEVWQFAMPDASTSVGGAATGGVLITDRLIVGSIVGRLYAVRLADGALLWERDAGGPQQSLPNRLLNVDGNAVFFRLDGHLEAVRPANGERVWQSQIGAFALGDLQHCNPFLCFAEGSVYVVRRTGALEWTTMGSGAADVVFLSNVEVDADGIMYAGIVRTGERTSIIAFEPPVRVGRTSLTAY